MRSKQLTSRAVPPGFKHPSARACVNQIHTMINDAGTVEPPRKVRRNGWGFGENASAASRQSEPLGVASNWKSQKQAAP
jgi:hypothetical protein